MPEKAQVIDPKTRNTEKGDDAKKPEVEESVECSFKVGDVVSLSVKKHKKQFDNKTAVVSKVKKNRIQVVSEYQ